MVLRRKQTVRTNAGKEDNVKFTGIVTLYNDFADLRDHDAVDDLLGYRATKSVPGTTVSIERVAKDKLKVEVETPADSVREAKLAIESSDVAKSVDWDRTTNAGCHGTDKINARRRPLTASAKKKMQMNASRRERLINALDGIYAEEPDEFDAAMTAVFGFAPEVLDRLDDSDRNEGFFANFKDTDDLKRLLDYLLQD